MPVAGVLNGSRRNAVTYKISELGGGQAVQDSAVLRS